jgi:hypothetical protein
VELLEVVLAKQLMEKIEAGDPISIENAIILGDIDLKNSDTLHKRYPVKSPIRIVSSLIFGCIDLGGCIFTQPIDFEDSRFHDKINFGYSSFNMGANFQKSIFRGVSDFQNACFRDQANFSRTEFCRYAIFSNSRFYEKGVFSECLFRQGADFRKMDCRDKVIFEGSRFLKSTHFEQSSFFKNFNFFNSWCREELYLNNSYFYDKADFELARFGNDVDYSNVEFNKEANFESCSFYKKVTFERSKFNDYANFVNVFFYDLANFGHSTSNFMLFNRFNYTENSKIIFSKSTFSRLEICWKDAAKLIEYEGPLYLELIRNYKYLGWFEDADKCYYKYRLENQNQKSWRDGSKYIDIIACITCGYGINPVRTLISSLFVILVFSIISLFIFNFLESDRINTFDAIYNSTVVFLVDPRGFGSNEFLKTIGLIERIVGWLLMALFLVTLGKVMIR